MTTVQNLHFVSSYLSTSQERAFFHIDGEMVQKSVFGKLETHFPFIKHLRVTCLDGLQCAQRVSNATLLTLLSTDNVNQQHMLDCMVC